MTTSREFQLDAIGDKTRRAILRRLRKGPMSVGEIARVFPVSRPAISQHLAVLKEAKLVSDIRDGRKRVYQLEPDGFASLREFFDEFWGVALVSFRRRIEETASEEEDE